MAQKSDAAWLEESLLALADQETDIRGPLFDQFFAAFPERRPAFLNLDAASRRMTDECLQMLYGLASGEGWVWPLVAELVATHHNYGVIPMTEYDGFIDATIEQLAAAHGEGWTADHAAAWGRQADALKKMVREATAGWAQAMAANRPGIPLP